MIEQLYKKENNLFQGKDWLSFQESYGRKMISFEKNDAFGVSLPLYFGKRFVWLQKAPSNLKNLEELKRLGKDVVFVRIEPGIVDSKAVKKTGLKAVAKGALLAGQKSPKATQVLDISKAEEEILAGMKPKTRYNIRLAEKKGVTVRISDRPEDVEIFYELLLKTSGRNKGEYMPHPKEYYRKMMESLAPSGSLKIVFAEYKGEPIAGIMISVSGEVATYLHGGFSDVHREVMAPYLCHWEAIKQVKAQGARFYDFWGVAESDDPADPWAGITRFKKGFGGETVVFAGAFDLVLNPFWYNVFSVMAKLRKVVR